MCEIIHTQYACKHVATTVVPCGVAWCRPTTRRRTSQESCRSCETADMSESSETTTRPRSPKQQSRKFTVVGLPSSYVQQPW